MEKYRAYKMGDPSRTTKTTILEYLGVEWDGGIPKPKKQRVVFETSVKDSTIRGAIPPGTPEDSVKVTYSDAVTRYIPIEVWNEIAGYVE